MIQVLKYNSYNYMVILMYKLCVLPYSYSSLEPFIDTHTMGLHYNKHLKNYLNKLNDLLIKNDYNFKYKLELLGYHLDEFKENDREDILFNLGGVINHIVYFSSISESLVLPSSDLMNKILKYFRTFDNFKKLFKESALKLKGSGYTYLVMDKDKNLFIKNFLNQDCPYFYEFIPLLCIDLWEHAYYINYENKRDLYIDNFFNIIDFDMANKMYALIANN